MSEATWSGPCDGCGEPMDAKYGEDLICGECAAEMFGPEPKTTYRITGQGPITIEEVPLC